MSKIKIDQILLTAVIILVSFIYGLPHLILSAKLGKDYTPFSLSPNSPSATDETYGYAGFANYIRNGHFFLKDAYVKEYSNFPTPLLADNIPSAILAGLSFLTGSLSNAFIVSDFIFPPIIFLVVYLFLRNYVGNNYYRLATSFLVVTARDLITLIPYPEKTITYLMATNHQEELLYLSRTPHPQISLIFLLAAVWMLHRLITKPTYKKYIILTGIFFGLLFYTYMFYFTFFSLFFFLITIFYLTKKETKVFKSLLISGFIAAIIASYYVYNVVQFYHLDIAADFLAKLKLLNSPLPWTLFRYVVLATLLFIFTKKRDEKFYVLFFFLITGIVIVPLARFFIGGDIETFHYVRFALLPFATITFFVMLYSLIQKNKKLTLVTSAVIFIVIAFFSLKTQIIGAFKIAPYHSADLETEAVFNWLNQNTNKDEVVGSLDQDFNRYLSVYTANKVYLPYTSRTIMPTYEGAKRYVLLSYVLGIHPDTTKKNLDEMIGYLFRYRTYDSNNNLDLNSAVRKWTENEINLVYKNKSSRQLNKYDLDYIVVTPEELKIVKPNLKYLTVITSISNYIILFSK